MLFRDNWIKQMLKQFKATFPDNSESQILNFLNKKFDEDFKDVDCSLYNNYENTEDQTTLTGIIEWEDKIKPNITYSGTFFKRHSEMINPATQVIRSKLADRKVEKKIALTYKAMAANEVDKEKRAQYKEIARKKKLIEGRLKVIANSAYGVLGMRTSFLFNIAVASSVTLTAQMSTATAYCAAENFLANSVYFWSNDECLDYIHNIVSEKKSRRYNDNDYVEDKSVKQVITQLMTKFIHKTKAVEWTIKNTLESLSQENLNRVYYKNNLHRFILECDTARNLVEYIMLNAGIYLDSTKPGKVVEKELKKLKNLLLEYVFYNHQIVDKPLRLKTEKRKIVKVIDTDSIFVYLNPWCEFVDTLLSGYHKISKRNVKNGRVLIGNRKVQNQQYTKDEEHAMFRKINMMVYIVTDVLQLTLDKYLLDSNIEPDAPGTIQMKQEFTFPCLLTTDAKKHYAGTFKIQEGRYFEEPQPVVVGLEYAKPSNSSEYARSFNDNLIFKNIFRKKLDPSRILKQVSEFEHGIENMIYEGDFNLLNVKKVKTADGYKDPLGIGQYKAAFVWNALYPDRKIELPGRIYSLKVKLLKPKDFADLSVNNPEMFERLTKLFENERIAKAGITAIGLPMDIERIPEWMHPYISMESIITTNTNLSLPMLKSLGISSIYKTKGKQFFSNIIQL